MNKNTNDKKNTNEVHIEQINPRTELNYLEKTALLQFKIEQHDNEEELSKTKQFRLLNSKHQTTNVELPAKKVGIGDTIKLKLSDLRNGIEEKNMNIPIKEQKNLYMIR